jgi:hypothetical protein
VFVEGGTAGNVTRPRHRHDQPPLARSFAAEAEAHVRALLAPVLDEGDEIELVDCAPGATPSAASAVRRLRRPQRPRRAGQARVDDVAFFAERGCLQNFGPGDAEIAHTAGGT